MNDSTFPATVHHIALTVTDVDASRHWYRALLGADPAIDEAVPALTGHHSGFHHTIFVLTGGTVLALHGHGDTEPADRFSEIRPGLDHIGFGCADRVELERLAARLDGFAVDALGHGPAGPGPLRYPATTSPTNAAPNPIRGRAGPPTASR